MKVNSWNDIAIHAYCMILGGSLIGLATIGHGGEYLFYGKIDEYHWSIFDTIGVIIGIGLGTWSTYHRYREDNP